MNGIIFLAIALALILYWKFSCQISWRYFGYGALAYLGVNLFQTLVMPLFLPPDKQTASSILYYCLVTGVTELIAIIVVVAISKKVRQSSWHQAVAAGIGWSVAYFFYIALVSLHLAILAYTTLSKLLDGIYPKLLVDNMLLAIIAVFLMVALIYAFTKQDRRWLAGAVVYKLSISLSTGLFYYFRLSSLAKPGELLGSANLEFAVKMERLHTQIMLLITIPAALIAIAGIMVTRYLWQTSSR